MERRQVLVERTTPKLIFKAMSDNVHTRCSFSLTEVCAWLTEGWTGVGEDVAGFIWHVWCKVVAAWKIFIMVKNGIGCLWHTVHCMLSADVGIESREGQGKMEVRCCLRANRLWLQGRNETELLMVIVDCYRYALASLHIEELRYAELSFLVVRSPLNVYGAMWRRWYVNGLQTLHVSVWSKGR